MSEPRGDFERLIWAMWLDQNDGDPMIQEWQWYRGTYQRMARALLKALAEPSEGMTEKAWSIAFDGGWELSFPQIETVFTAMINHILQEGAEHD